MIYNRLPMHSNQMDRLEPHNMKISGIVLDQSSSFRVFEAGWLYDSFPFLYTVLCVFIEHCKILWAALVG